VTLSDLPAKIFNDAEHHVVSATTELHITDLLTNKCQ